jgi:site-specific DNA recombinase
MTIETAMRRVATYERVSSEDQRERETIKTQTEQLARSLARQSDIELVERFVDDGVSGTIPIAERPAGGRLMRAAAAGQFDELHVYKFDRMGRDAVDLLVVRRRFMDLGVRVVSVVEGEPDLLGYDVQAVVADHARRDFLRRSADGMSRAAREGRYTGGIVSFGLRVRGKKKSARLVPDETLVWADQTAADVARWVYERAGIDRWSCRRIADELNGRGVPTHYSRDDRLVTRKGLRAHRTQGVWRSGRIRNLIVNPVYRGELQYGRRTTPQTRGREVIAAPVKALVSPALWHAAQEALAANRTIAKNTRRKYLLRGVIHCGIDGLSYCGTQGRGVVAWYRCTGQMVERGPLPGRCWGQSIRTDAIEPQIWADIERWLRDPGDILGELDPRGERDTEGAVAAVESITLARALDALEQQKQRAVGLAVRGVVSEDDLRVEVDRIAIEKTELERRVAALEASSAPVVPEAAIDLLAEVRARLDAGLTEDQRQEIVRLLVRITIHTETAVEGGRKTARASVEYRFPAVVETGTGTDSSPPRAGSGRASLPRRPRVRSQSGLPRVADEAPRGRHGRIPAARRGTARRDGRASPRRATSAAPHPRVRHRRLCGGAPGRAAASRSPGPAPPPPPRRSPLPPAPRRGRAAAAARGWSARAGSCRIPARRS